ncbi:hypothetical protein [Streptomyces sp. bgisy031]|uniref:hypothetical protein n=1 Tax=Streptomyces sp. bgisy031 TaxID=3413772 RepID=UPI003D758DE4
MQRTVSGLHPAQCRHRAASPADGHSPRASLCAARLDQIVPVSTAAESDLPTLLALQRRIDRQLTLDHDASGSGRQGSNRYFFPDLIVAAHLIRLSWPDGACFVPSTSLADLLDRHTISVVQ